MTIFQESNGTPIAVKGEQALWRAVITQALMDAASQSKKAELQYEKSQAFCWLERNSEDFRTVCDYANLNPIYVRRESEKALAAGCVWRAGNLRRGHAQSNTHRTLEEA